MAKILIIEDNKALRALLQLYLSAEDHTVCAVADGNQGIELARTKSFNLVITDIFMPEKDGLETIVDLRRLDPKMKIIAISGYSVKDAVLASAAMLGAARTLTKPFQPEELLQAVDEMLKT